MSSPSPRNRVSPQRYVPAVVDVDDVRAFALTLPRTTEALVRDRVKFRVGRIVYLAFSRDATIMGFGFPKEEREALVRSEPDKFLMPDRGDLRTTGCRSGSTRSTKTRCGSSSSTPGGWWSPSASPPTTRPADSNDRITAPRHRQELFRFTSRLGSS